MLCGDCPGTDYALARHADRSRARYRRALRRSTTALGIDLRPAGQDRRQAAETSWATSVMDEMFQTVFAEGRQRRAMSRRARHDRSWIVCAQPAGCPLESRNKTECRPDAWSRASARRHRLPLPRRFPARRVIFRQAFPAGSHRARRCAKRGAGVERSTVCPTSLQGRKCRSALADAVCGRGAGESQRPVLGTGGWPAPAALSPCWQGCRRRPIASGSPCVRSGPHPFDDSAAGAGFVPRLPRATAGRSSPCAGPVRQRTASMQRGILHVEPGPW